mmetsp:Transcript_33152/g.99905  ORF Transcript_33152/g.99905 Transcript_33152/m.99905 type:complete len:284 (+) Transcript_33152:1534-2385(+)
MRGDARVELGDGVYRRSVEERAVREEHGIVLEEAASRGIVAEGARRVAVREEEKRPRVGEKGLGVVRGRPEVPVALAERVVVVVDARHARAAGRRGAAARDRGRRGRGRRRDRRLERRVYAYGALEPLADDGVEGERVREGAGGVGRVRAKGRDRRDGAGQERVRRIVVGNARARRGAAHAAADVAGRVGCVLARRAAEVAALVLARDERELNAPPVELARRAADLRGRRRAEVDVAAVGVTGARDVREAGVRGRNEQEDGFLGGDGHRLGACQRRMSDCARR